MPTERRAKRLLMVADDYGLSPAIDAAIVALAHRGRLSAVSCMVHAAPWPESARALRELPVPMGLHLNLTEGTPCSTALRRVWPQLPSLPRLLCLAHAGALPRGALFDEVQTQVARFEQAVGRAPAHLDGHQHVHRLPGVNVALQPVLAQRPALRVRRIDRIAGPGWWLKRRLIRACAGTDTAPLWQNDVLLGVYDFQSRDYRALMQGWLQGAPARGGLLFCHPATRAGTPGDPITAARWHEYDYLAGPRFLEDLEVAGVDVHRDA